MGKEEVFAYEWTCDWCGRKKLLPADDKEPPFDWIVEGVHAFCCWSHRCDYHKDKDAKAK